MRDQAVSDRPLDRGSSGGPPDEVEAGRAEVELQGLGQQLRQKAGAANVAIHTCRDPSIRWIGATNADHGHASVWIDGAAAFTVDTYSPQAGYRALLLERAGLADGAACHHHRPDCAQGQGPGYCQDVDAFGG